MIVIRIIQLVIYNIAQMLYILFFWERERERISFLYTFTGFIETQRFQIVRVEWDCLLGQLLLSSYIDNYRLLDEDLWKERGGRKMFSWKIFEIRGRVIIRIDAKLGKGEGGSEVNDTGCSILNLFRSSPSFQARLGGAMLKQSANNTVSRCK